jgi:hypothetical protein
MRQEARTVLLVVVLGTIIGSPAAGTMPTMAGRTRNKTNL